MEEGEKKKEQEIVNDEIDLDLWNTHFDHI